MIIAVGALVGIVAIGHDNHSDYSDYSDYSEYGDSHLIQQVEAAKAKKDQAKRNLDEAEQTLRAEGGIEKDEKGRQFFKVGFTDTTGAIQYFTMSGLRWMDSPGTGAIAQKDDHLDMEKLVEEYIPYTDFCLFLVNSAEPGQMKRIGMRRKTVNWYRRRFPNTICISSFNHWFLMLLFKGFRLFFNTTYIKIGLKMSQLRTTEMVDDFSHFLIDSL